MDGFIKLTNRSGRSESTRASKINSVAAFDGKTWVLIDGRSECYEVNETPEEILALIKVEENRKLRDEFAKAALTSYLPSLPKDSDLSNMNICTDCIRLADAMMEARK